MEPSGRITRNRRKLEQERHQAQQDAKRACTQFLPRVVIGPQDIVGNRSVPKVKVQAESVKREVVELAQTPQEELVKEVQLEEKTEQVQINGEVDKEHLIVKQEVDKVVTTPKTEEVVSQRETSPVVEQEISIDDQNSKVTMRSVGTDTAGESSVNVEEALRKEIEVLKREGIKKDARIKSLVVKVEDLKQEVRRFEQLNERLLDAVNDNNGDQPSSESQLISPEPRNSKIFLLFPQVSQVLWTKYGYPTLGKKHFLTCRLVCSSWKSSIDTMDQGPVENLKEFINVYWENGHFEEISSVYNEYKKYDIQPSTLKISAGFHNKVYTDPNFKCRPLITKFLTLYGHSIKVFAHCENSVALETHFESVEDWYKTLTGWLTLMPNLEVLTIQRHNPSFPNPDEDYPSPPPFPFLARLNSFTSTGIPASVIRRVLFANPQISQVNLKLKKVLNAIFDNLPLPHLSSLTVHFLSCKIANLRSLQLIDAENLSTLNMQVSSHGSKQVVCFGVTRLIARFQNTIQALQLDCIEPDKLVQDFPQLPKLTKLDVELKYDAVIEKSLNLLRFLTPMQLSLEQLRIKESHGCGGYSEGSSGCRCRGTNAWERYKRINTKFVRELWSKWKKLKSVTICTAHGYQKSHSQEFWFIRKRYC